MTINAGCANGWSKEESEFVQAIENELKKYSSYKSYITNIGRCYEEYKYQTDFATLIYTVDSSD